jgi:phosphomannomutase
VGVFKTYDIRGIWGEDIDISLTYRIGRGCARIMEGSTFLVGHDARSHSKEMYHAFIRGLTVEGRTVRGIGLCSTPQLHYIQYHRSFDAAAMITASHNPPRYHGIKLFNREGGSVSYGRGLEELEQEVSRLGEVSSFEESTDSNSYSEIEGLADYIGFLCAAAEGMFFPFKVVMDTSNGSAGKVFESLAEALGLEAVLLNTQPDGNFPNHDPNPLKEESRVQISKTILETKADLGGLLDGDGDRIIFFDERGAAVENYFISALIAEEVLRCHPGGAIVYDLISSRVLPERIGELGGRAVVSRVGYTFVHENMVANDAAFGTEASGHVYFKVSESYYTESAAYALIVLLKVLARKGRPLSELMAPLRKRYFQAPETNLEVKNKDRALRLVEERFGDGHIEKLDGISVSYRDFWFNLRPSNTEPLLRLRLEAINGEVAKARTGEIVKIVADA